MKAISDVEGRVARACWVSLWQGEAYDLVVDGGDGDGVSQALMQELKMHALHTISDLEEARGRPPTNDEIIAEVLKRWLRRPAAATTQELVRLELERFMAWVR